VLVARRFTLRRLSELYAYIVAVIKI